MKCQGCKIGFIEDSRIGKTLTIIETGLERNGERELAGQQFLQQFRFQRSGKMEWHLTVLNLG